MMVSSNTLSVAVGLMKEQTLNCEFAIDHKSAHLTVEWLLQRKAHRSKLYSYSSQTGKSEGSGVSVKAIGKGDASFNIPLTRETSEGTYVCSVQVPPLLGSHDIALHIMGEDLKKKTWFKITYWTIKMILSFGKFNKDSVTSHKVSMQRVY